MPFNQAKPTALNLPNVLSICRLAAVPVAAQAKAAATRRGVTAAPWTPPKKVAAPCRAMSAQRFHKSARDLSR